MELPIRSPQKSRHVNGDRFTPYFRPAEKCRLPRSSPTQAEKLSVQQPQRLETKATKYMKIAPTHTAELSKQIRSLQSPRECVDEGGDLVDRFVTDNPGKSGRVYDRLHQQEVPRVIPVFAKFVNRMVLDVLTGLFRQRTMIDDMRDMAAGKNLEVSQEEAGLTYYVAVGSNYSVRSIKDE